MNPNSPFFPGCPPPLPPVKLTPTVATDPRTSPQTLWYIAQHVPHRRRWLIANESATPELLEFIAQAGGPGVAHAFAVLFDDLIEDTDT